MPRSVKKGPYVAPKLIKKVNDMKKTGKKRVIQTYSRCSTVIPDFIGLTIAVHNGKTFIPVYITEDMVGHKLGEFSLTRTFRGHAGKIAERLGRGSVTRERKF